MPHGQAGKPPLFFSFPRESRMYHGPGGHPGVNRANTTASRPTGEGDPTRQE